MNCPAKPKVPASAMRRNAGSRATSHSPCRSGPTRSGVRRSRGCVSGRIPAVATAMRAPKTTRNQKIHGHGPTSRIHPPTTGAIAGAIAKIMTIWLITCWARGPS